MEIQKEDKSLVEIGKLVEEIKEKHYADLNNYQKIPKFEDLRKYEMSNELFISLWKIQDFLYTYSKLKDEIKKNNPRFFAELQEQYGIYHKELYGCSLKK